MTQKLSVMKLQMLWILYQQICQQLFITKMQDGKWILYSMIYSGPNFISDHLLFTIAICCYHHTKHRPKLKKKMRGRSENIKVGNNES